MTIPDSVTSIEYAAFYNCSTLADVTYTGTQAQWSSLASGGIGDDNDSLLNATIHCTDGVLNGSASDSTTYSITVTSTNGGTVSVSHPEAEEGQTITITAAPDQGNVVSMSNIQVLDTNGQSVDIYPAPYGGGSTSGAAYVFNMPSSNVTVTAVFQPETVITPIRISDLTAPSLTQYIPFSTRFQCVDPLGLPVSDARWSIAAGSLPPGVTLDEDGGLSGAPTAAGTFPVTIAVSPERADAPSDSRTINLTVQDIVSADWETVISDGYEILDRITDMYKYEDQSFRVAGPLSEFQSFYLDGNPLTAGTDYTTEEGSTRLNIPAATFQTAGEGTHTVAAAFTDSSGALRVSGQNYIVDLSGNMQILTFGVNEYDTAVQYVPFSAVINAVPLYGDLRFVIVDRGNLPDDWEQAPGNWSLNPETGEITGVPQTAGTEYQFVVGVKHGDNGEVFDQTNVKITVMDNTRTNVTQETDPGFQVITPIPDMYEATVNVYVH